MLRKYGKVAAILILLGIAAGVLIFLRADGRLQKGQKELLRTTLLKVGKADAIILQSGDETMVIDAGEEEDGEEIAVFLKNCGVSYIDTLIITHFDKDHVGGADTLIEMIGAGEVFLPDYQGDSTEYLDFMNALDEKDLVPHRLSEAVEFELGDASVLVEPPISYTAGNTAEVDNNFSLITTVVHGENRLLFMGDAEKQRIREWITSGTSADCDFLKVPHHGVYNMALKELIEAVTPEYAAICSSKKNPADEKTLEALKQKNVKTFQTKDGDIVVISDGKNLKCSQ